MWNPTGEIPQIVFLHIGNKALPVPINGRDPCRPVEHDRPFIRRMPVQFTNASGCESHVYPCQGLRDGQFPNGHLARPSAFVSPLVRKRERIFEVLNQAFGIGSGWPRGIPILRVQGLIRGAGIGCAPVSPSFVSHLPLLRRRAAYRQAASDRCQGCRADSDKSATRKSVFRAVILHCANPPSYTRSAALTLTGGVNASLVQEASSAIPVSSRYSS